MLTGNLVKPRLRANGSAISIDLIDECAPYYLKTARELIELLQGQVGQTRTSWEQALEAYEGERVDYIIIRGLAKVLADHAVFVPRETPLPPQELRQKLFASGPVFAKSTLFFPHTRLDVIERVSLEYGMTAQQVAKALYADLRPAFLLQNAGPLWEPTQLLARYNLELARAALYYASLVHIEVFDHFKDLFKFIKLFKLMFEATPLDGGGYEIELYGPISQFISSTRRYGRQFAAWLPALLLCERWQMTATLRLSIEQGGGENEEEAPSWSKNQTEFSYCLDASSPLQTHFKSSGAFDSALEATFAEEFLDFIEKFGDQRGRWQLLREPEFIILQDTVMIPDFAVQHVLDPSRRILIELVGYWNPVYLERKLRKLREAQCAQMLVFVYEGLNVSAEDFQGIASEVVFFKQKPVMNVVLPAIEQLAEKIYGPLQQKPSSFLSLSELALAYYGKKQQSEKEEWFLMAEAGILLKQLDPTFTPSRYGYKDLSSLVRSNETLFATRRRSAKGRPIEVCLLSPSPTTNSEQPVPSPEVSSFPNE